MVLEGDHQMAPNWAAGTLLVGMSFLAPVARLSLLHRGRNLPAMRSSAVVVSLFLLGACSAVEPTPSDLAARFADIHDLPDVRLNDVSGSAVGWCPPEDACVEGPGADEATAPRASEPLTAHLPAGATIARATALGPATSGGRVDLEVEVEGTTVGPLPPGTVLLELTVILADERSVGYVWAVGDRS